MYIVKQFHLDSQPTRVGSFRWRWYAELIATLSELATGCPTCVEEA
jgi:hypothetical protein